MLSPDGVEIRRRQDSIHFAIREMLPFGPLRNIDGLSEEYSQIYLCAPRPFCSAEDTSCGPTPYLFCDVSRYRCVPQLQQGANCQRFATYNSCYNGVCCNGTCVAACGTMSQPERQESQRSPLGPQSQRSQSQRPQPPRPESQRSESQRPQSQRPQMQQRQRSERPRGPPSPSEMFMSNIPKAHSGVPTHAPFVFAPAPTHPPSHFRSR